MINRLRKFKIFSKGFTLIELVISIALLSLIIGIGADLMTHLVRINRKTAVFSSIESYGNFTLKRMKEDIRRALDVKIVSSSPSPTANQLQYTEGDEIELIISEVNTLGQSTSKVISYKIEECSSGNVGSLKAKVDTGNYEEFAQNYFNTSSNPLNQKLYVKRLQNNVKFFSNYKKTVGIDNFNILYITYVIAESCTPNAYRNIFQTSINLNFN